MGNLVAIVGRPNVGKSTLFNRLTKTRHAIVSDEAGTTRDRQYGKCEWNGREFSVVDTGGWVVNSDDVFEEEIRKQVIIATEEADLVLFLCDINNGVTGWDMDVAQILRRAKLPVILVANKADDGKDLYDQYEFYKLGLGDPYPISAATGSGTGDLLDKVLEILPEKPKDELEDGIPRFAVVGRPNAGKSSIINAFIGEDRNIVTDIAGTTRDVNRTEIRYKGRTIELLDTAGLRKPGKREVGIEKFSAIRTLAAIEEADVCALLVDATEPHSKLDQSLAGQIIEAGKGIIIVVTKSDLLENATPTNYFGEENIGNRTAADFLIDGLEKDFNFLPYAPVVLTSSETGENVTQLFELALQVTESRKTEIKTSDLNKILNEAILEHAPAGLKNTRPKPKYIVQTDTCPPWFVVHGHDLELLHWSWKRFLERKIREKYPFIGTPIMFSFRNDKSDGEK